MTMNPLPPQAYTKETLGKAFAWLQAQSENIKEMATSPDILVSLYLKAKLNGNGALDRPSIQNFKSELRSLAGMMGEFEVMDPSAGLEARVQSEMQAGGSTERPPHAHVFPPQAVPPVTPSSTGAAAFSFSPPPPPSQYPISASAAAVTSDLDPRSLALIREVKNDLNLSSEQEALRMLISLGAKSLRKL
jgi:hypothetical protein